MAAAILRFPRRGREADKGEQQDAARLLSRFQYLLGVQRLFANEWQEIADYVLPRKSSIIVRKIPGGKRTQRLFDSTALDARNKFASAIHGGLTSGYIRWFFLETDSPELNADQATGVWLDQVGERMLGEFNRSNFAQEIDETYVDLVTFASGCVLFEEKPVKRPGIFEGFRFEAQQPGRYAWSEGPDGMVDTVFREIQMPRSAVKQRWRDVPDEEMGGDNPDEMMSVIHAVAPDERGESWRSVYLLTARKYKLSEKSYREFPFLCPRWSKNSGETYGRGPTHDAMPDIRSLNKLREMELRALPKIVDPPLVAVNGDVIGPARLVPGGVTNVRGSRESIGPLLSGIDLRQSGLSAEQLEGKIRAIYHENELQFQEGPQMTATEAMARREMMQMLLGPTLGRLEKELLHPLISRGFNILKRARQLPALPPALAQAVAQKRVMLRVRYDGPIARAQRASDVDSMTRLMNFATPVLQVDPGASDVLDGDEMIRVAARKLGVPPTVVRDREQAGQLRAAKAEQAEQQQQAQQVEQTANAAGAAAPMLKTAMKKPEPGSPMDRIVKQNPTSVAGS